MPRLFKRRRKVGAKIKLSRKWWGEYDDAGKKIRVPLHADKGAATLMLGQLTRDSLEGGSPVGRQVRRPLAEHLDEWERALEAKGTTVKQVAQVVARARRVIDGCGFKTWADIQPSRVQAFLANLTATRYSDESGRPLPASAQTRNFHLAAVKQLCKWMVEDRRAAHNPLAGMHGVNVQADRRHDRQTLTPAQLDALYRAALESSIEYRGLTGTDRYWLYLLASVTGFRAGELAELTPALLLLTEDPPVALLPARHDKRRKPVRQPLPAEIVAATGAWVAGRPTGERLWAGTWHERAAAMLRIDLAAAGIPYEVEGPDGPLFADFHSLRHSYIALLDRAGATLKQAMQLARHSDPRLTMRTYGRAALADLGSVVDRILTVPAVHSRATDERKSTTDRKIG